MEETEGLVIEHNSELGKFRYRFWIMPDIQEPPSAEALKMFKDLNKLMSQQKRELRKGKKCLAQEKE